MSATGTPSTNGSGTTSSQLAVPAARPPPPGTIIAVKSSRRIIRRRRRHRKGGLLLPDSSSCAHRFQRLLSAVVFPQTALRAPPDRSALHGRGRGGLWALGLTSELPIALVRIDHLEFSELFREVLLAQEFWRLNGVAIRSCLCNITRSSYCWSYKSTAYSASHATWRPLRRSGPRPRKAPSPRQPPRSAASGQRGPLETIADLVARERLSRRIGRQVGMLLFFFFFFYVVTLGSVTYCCNAPLFGPKARICEPIRAEDIVRWGVWLGRHIC